MDQEITLQDRTCTFGGCNFTFDPAIVDDQDSHGGVATGWVWAEDTGDQVGPHEHRLPAHVDL